MNCNRRYIDMLGLSPDVVKPGCHLRDLIRHLGRGIIPRTRIDSPAVAQRDRAEYVRTVNREHQDIYGAIARGDADGARAAMRPHLANRRERLRHLRERRAV